MSASLVATLDQLRMIPQFVRDQIDDLKSVAVSFVWSTNFEPFIKKNSVKYNSKLITLERWLELEIESQKKSSYYVMRMKEWLERNDLLLGKRLLENF